MPYNASGAAQYAESHAGFHPTGHCAQYVRKAIEYGGGITLVPTTSAKDYGSRLTAAGFYEASNIGVLQAGDVVVIQPIPGHPHGHMAIFTGGRWVSDYKQSGGVNGFYPGQAYQLYAPSYRIYRHN